MSDSTLALAHEIEIRPEFHDLDPMDIVWHGTYPRYLEAARCALLRRFDYDYPQMLESGFTYPIVEMSLKYVRSLRYRQRVIVRAEITEWENRLRIDYVMRDGDTNEKLNKAHTIQVAVSKETGEMAFVCPPILWKKLGVSP